jgi:hypothetical protein
MTTLSLPSGCIKARARPLVIGTPESPIFPETGNLSTRHLLKSDGPQLLRGFHPGKSRSLVARTPDLAIPDFPKWEISRHVASVNRTAQIYPGVFTMENPELLSTGIPIPRFPISRNGRSYDTWPPSIGRPRSIPGFPQWKVPISCQQDSRFPDSRFPEMGDLLTRGLR